MWSLGAPAALNARTMDGLARRLARNATWFGAYLRHNSVLKSINEDCDEECRKVHSCAISNVDFDDFRMCATQARALSANFGALVRPSAISALLTVLLLLWNDV